MDSLFGAHRSAFTRKILWIAVAAIVLVLAWAKAGFPTPTNPWYSMGSDGVLHVDGMMPPDGGRRMAPANDDITMVQQGQGRTYTYVASPNHGAYLVKRDGVSWATLTLNKKTGLYELSDPNGSGSPVLKLGTPRGVIIKAAGPSSTH